MGEKLSVRIGFRDGGALSRLGINSRVFVENNTHVWKNNIYRI